MSTNKTEENSLQHFSNAVFQALVGAMTEVSGRRWSIKEAASTGIEPGAVCIGLTFEGDLRGEAMLQFERASAAMLASRMLQEPARDPAAQPDALLEVVNAALPKFRSTTGSRYGAFTVLAALASAPLKDAAATIQIVAADDDSNRAPVVLHLGCEIAEALMLLYRPESGATSDRKSAKSEKEASNPHSLNLDLVMDVELNVTLRFGQRRLTLREVMDLTSGSVVELDRQVEEPVELLLDGVVIARGEAVVIDGNYGIRVTEVSKAVSASVLG